MIVAVAAAAVAGFNALVFSMIATMERVDSEYEIFEQAFASD